MTCLSTAALVAADTKKKKKKQSNDTKKGEKKPVGSTLEAVAALISSLGAGTALLGVQHLRVRSPTTLPIND